MHTGEIELNVEMAEVLDGMRRRWHVKGQRVGRVFESKDQPDILVMEEGAKTVIIENEYVPAATLEEDVRKKTMETMTSGEKIESVIGVRVPNRLKKFTYQALRNKLKEANDLEYVIYNPSRFPQQGWMRGGLRDVAVAAQMLSIPQKRVDECVDLMLFATNKIADLIGKPNHEMDKRDLGTQKKIAFRLFQSESEQTWKMTGLLLSNAFVFHSHLSGNWGIKTLMELRSEGVIPLVKLIETWEKILKHNYHAIFEIARDVLTYCKEETAQQIIEILVETTCQIISRALARSTDMYGSLLQRMIKDRKLLASFYTLSESAALLASMVVPVHTSQIYTNKESMLSYKVADFACGTGTLLTSVYRSLGINYEYGGKSMENIHASMVENSIYGIDVLPIAAHLTVSALASVFPRIKFEGTRIGTIKLGEKGGKLYLGSLDLIMNATTFDEMGTYITGSGEEKLQNMKITNSSFDLITMNPPFTGNTREGGREGRAMFASFGIPSDVQKAMKSLEKKRFADTCSDGAAGEATNFIAIADKKLKPGGTIGFILPSTIHYGSSWSKVRDLLTLKYNNLTIISIASSCNSDMSFSADTKINEVMLVATKTDKKTLDCISDINSDIAILRKKITKNKNMLKRKKTKFDKNTIKQIVENLETQLAKHEGKLDAIRAPKRGKFASIYKRPDSIFLATEIGKSIIRNAEVIKMERNTNGGSLIGIGEMPYGTMLDCPLNFGWWFVGVQDPSLVQSAYFLSLGKLRLPGQSKTYHIPMTVLGERLGFSTRDIASTPDKAASERAPFIVTSIPSNIKPTHYALWRNDKEKQTSMVVEPDRMLTEKEHATAAQVKKIASTASRIHLNRLIRFSTQYLSVLFTKEKSLGGESLPNVCIDRKFEKAFTVWGNSTLGLLSYWASSGRQNGGRGLHSRTSLQALPILDFEMLTEEQLNKFDDVFDKHATKNLLGVLPSTQRQG